MKKQKRELLNNTFNSFIEVGLSGENLEILEDIVFKDVVGFGTTVDEKLFGVKELRDLLIRQKEQSAGMALSWKINTLDLYISSDENTAIFTNEITLYLILDDNPIEIYLRFSIVMEYGDDKWMVVHWHGSKPEHVESEKDTWGVQTWKEKAEELENLVAERTADLVVKNRELEIETALERIRAQAVAMKESTDLLDIVVTMRNEFIKLGHEAHYFWHMMWLPETYEKAMTSGDGTKIGFVMQLPRHIHANIPQLAKWEKSTKPTVVYTMTVDEAIDYVDKMVSLGDFKNIDPQAPSHDDIRHIGGLTFIMARTTHGEIGYSLPGIVEHPPKDDLDILIRFAGAFDLAHQRFLDLQKAEKQARETQIELALEKIRSRSMAMYKSDELKEIILVVYDQLVQLQVKVEHAGFIIDYKEHEDMHIWLADRNSVFPKIVLPYFDCAHWNNFNEAKKTGQNFFTNQLGFEEKNKFYKDVFQFIPNLPDDTKTTYFEFEGLAISTVLLDNVGLYIENYSGIPFSDEENAILMRFGKVFQQAYTRFLDLQKAEAQTREAQIEAALEKVRSRSLAMHSTNELGEVVTVIVEKLKELDVILDANGVVLCTYFTDSKDVLHWIAAPDFSFAGSYLLPYFDHPIFNDAWQSRESGALYFSKAYSIEDKNSFFEYAFEHSEYKHFPEDFKQWVFQNDQHILSFAWQKNSAILIPSHTGVVPSAEDVSILKRFAKVFEQSYTRFLDLQKAEAQAREAQIEAALEKVRSRSMAMHNSQELNEVALELRKQMGLLGQKDLEVCAIHLYGNDEDSFESWSAMKASGSENEIVQTQAHFPKRGIRIVDEMMDHYNIGTKDYVLVNEGEKIAEWFKVLKKHAPELHASILDSIGKVPVKQLKANWAVADFSGGALVMVTYDEPDELSRNLLRRSANVFEQAYVRFLDLQKAEAQTKESQIQLSLERVRAKTMAMQHSDELREVVLEIYEQLQQLDFESQACNIIIIDQNTHDQKYWVSGFSQELYPESYHVPNLKHPYIQLQIKAWEKGKTYEVFKYQGIEKKKFDELFFSKTDFKKSPKEAQEMMRSLESITLSTAFTKYGSLQVLGPVPLNEEKTSILLRFAKVFNQTYTRFLDLQKAEAQAREAQIESGLERVRSRSLGMHKTSELQSVIHTVHQELLNLNITISGGSFIVINNEIDTELHCWGSGGTANTSDKIHIPRFEKPFYTHLLKRIKSGPGFFTEEYSQDEKIEFFTFLFKHQPWSKLSSKEKKHTLSTSGGYTRSCLVSTHTSIFIINHFGEKFSESENTILKRFGKVFEQTYTRFLDLQKAEAQARKAQIEVAVERVRAKALAMHKSTEILQVAMTLKEQMEGLNLSGITAATIYLEHDDSKIRVWDITELKESENGPQLSSDFIFRLEDTDPGLWVRRVWNASEKYSVIEMSGDDFIKCEKWIREYDETAADNYREFIRAAKIEHTWHPTVQLEKGKLNLDFTVPPPPEMEFILPKMGAAFDLAYRRFLDLQKAEAQARETQIQLALERVRAKTMAMKTQSDLLGIVELFGQQLSDLDVMFNDVTFIEGAITKNRDWELWSHVPNADNFTHKIHIPYIDTPYFTKTAKAVEEYERTGNPIQTKFFSKEEKNEFLDHYWKYAPAVPNKIMDLVYSNPGSTIVDAFLEEVTVSIVRNDLEPFTDEELSIFERFAKEFKQTYIRFLDIKKAEEQAKESKIEAALEKVRSRSLAMHRSDELKEVVSVLFENLNELQIPFTAVGIATNIEGSKDLNAFVCGQNETGLVITNYRLPYFDNPVSKDVYGAIEKQLDYFVGHYSKEEKDAFYEYVIEHTDEFRHLPEDIKRMIFDSTSYTISMVAVKNAVFNINDFEGKVLAENEIDIIKRFARVFEQAYIRFLDLQKAEAQAREAQIEAALEKVRSRTLAMQKSDELAETSVVVFKELLKLGIEPNRLFIGIVKDNAEAIDAWATNEDGSKIEQHYTLYTSKNKSIKEMVDGWKQQKKSAIIDMKGKELQEYFHYLNRVMHIPFIHGLKQKRRVQSIAYFSGGLIGMASPKEQPQGTINLLERFAAVFNLTYTRFKDLKIAEAQARQAEVDLINLQKAKKNAEEALAELQTTQKQLIQQEKLASLGQLTAGIAHEIKNPLNFVNNFSEVSIELIDEALDEINQIENNPHAAESTEILIDVKANLTKIHEHGSRADSIVKSMLMHSRGGSGKMEPTYLNALIKEYVNLAFHGMRAGKNPISVAIDLQLDELINRIPLVEEDFSRVLLNLCNNAFDAMRERLNTNEQIPNSKEYRPKLTVRTISENGQVSIEIEDNGPGIPDDIKDKILQPFFTTKKGTEGTGLGLSITDDIIKAHGGILNIKSEIGKGSTFIIALEKNR